MPDTKIDFSWSKFELITDEDPFLNAAVVVRRHVDDCHVYAIEVGVNQVNAIGIAHGGMLATFADTALGASCSRECGYTCVTVNLTLDYLASARIGEMVVAEVEVTKQGRSLIYADCYLSSIEGGLRTRLVRASGVFKATSKVNRF